MRKLLTILLLSFTMCAMAVTPPDSTSVQDSSNSDKWKSEFTLASRNIYRGVSYGESPSVQGMFAWMPCKYYEIGTYGNYTLNGVKEGYGNQVNLYMTFKPFSNNKSALKNISVTLDDFFYFNENDDDNNYFDWSPEKTKHFIEGRIKYDSRFDLTAGYVVYQTEDVDDLTTIRNENDDPTAVYIEAGYDITSNVNMFVGYLSGRSNLMFQEEGGVSNVGITYQRKLNINNFSPLLKTSLVASPLHETHMDYPGVGRTPIALVFSITM